MILFKPGLFSLRPAAALLITIGLSALTAGCMTTGDAQMSASSASMAAENAGARVTPIFIASTRRNDGRAEGESVADGGAHYAMSMVSVPPGHRAGQIEEPSFGKPTPSKHFAVLGGHALEPQDFRLQV